MPASERKIYNDAYARANALFVNLPITPAVGWFDLGVDLTTSVRNLGYYGATAAGLGGTPSAAAGYLGFTANANYLQTAIADADLDSFTIVSVMRVTSAATSTATQPRFMGTRPTASADDGGFGWGITTTAGYPATLAAQLAYTPSGGGSPTYFTRSLTGFTEASWRMMALSLDATTGEVNVRDLTNSLSTSGSWPSGATRLSSSSNLRIGSDPGATSAGGTIDMAIAGVWDSALSLDTLTTLKTWLAPIVLARKGITI